jgi:NAD(P)-dependent dehydrogenase (short-subunit alcohol dehydrogenase family)
MPGLMQNKTVLITGATAGIGLVTARELAGMGAQITLVSRNAAKLMTAAEQIKTQTGNTNVEYIAADLATRTGVNQTAFEFKKRHTRLDVLINNAGALFTERQVTPDGLELTFALNHLSYFLLTMLLLETLKASTAGRVVNVASDAHRGQTINFDDLQGEKGYNGLTAYGRSKLMNVLFTYELARKLKETNVTANALHPGFVATGFAKNNGPLYKIGMKLIGFFARSPEQGAETSIYLASSPEVKGVSGKYFADSRAVDSDPVSYDEATAERLWNVSLEMIA